MVGWQFKFFFSDGSVVIVRVSFDLGASFCVLSLHISHWFLLLKYFCWCSLTQKNLFLFLFRSLSPILAGGPFMFTLITLCFSPGLSKQVLVLLVRMRILFAVLVRGVCLCR